MCLELSPEHAPELFAAFAKAQADMGDVLKGNTNPAFKSKYADLAAVVAAVMPAMSKHGLAVIQAPAFDGERVSVETVIAHSAGGWMRSTLHMRPTKSDPQGVGSAITYARRYALLGACGVAPEDDDGNAASQGGSGGQRFGRANTPSSEAQEQFAAINAASNRDELEAWRVKNKPAVTALADAEGADVIAHYRKRFAALAPPPEQEAA